MALTAGIVNTSFTLVKIAICDRHNLPLGLDFRKVIALNIRSGEGKVPLKISEAVANNVGVFLHQTQDPSLPACINLTDLIHRYAGLRIKIHI